MIIIVIIIIIIIIIIIRRRRKTIIKHTNMHIIIVNATSKENRYVNVMKIHYY